MSLKDNEQHIGQAITVHFIFKKFDVPLFKFCLFIDTSRLRIKRIADRCPLTV